MKKIDIFGIAVGNFWRRKTRSILSVLGVVIGTASIVCMMSVGIAMSTNMQKQMEESGNMNQVEVYAGYDEKTGQRKALTDEIVEQIRQIDNVKSLTPIINLNGKSFSGKYQAQGSILGVDFAYLTALGAKATEGHLPTDQDLSSGKNIICLMGSSMPYRFEKPQKSRRMMSGRGMYMSSSFGGDGPEGVVVPEGGYAYDGKIFDDQGKQVGTYPPIVDVLNKDTKVRYTYDWSYGEHNPGETLTVKKKATLYTLNTVGILDSLDYNFNYGIIIDLDTARRIQKDQQKWESSQNQGGTTNNKKEEFSYDQLLVLSDNLDHTMELTSQIKALGLEANSNSEWIKQNQEQMATVQMVFAGIGFVSLLVAAIGIANTMIMSIYERTREIGIMKVIGCYLKDIRTMFLTEAAVIGFLGGLLGVILSYIVSAVMNFVSAAGDGNGGILGIGYGGAQVSMIPPWLSLMAIGFAIVIALLSGFFPARRAMKLSALTAMQT